MTTALEMPQGLPSLPDGWDYQVLESLLEPKGIAYGIVQPGTYEPSGVPIVRVKDLRGGRIERGDALRVSPEIEAKYDRTRLRGGEVLLSLVGSVGEVAVVPEDLAGWNVARAIAVMRPVSVNSDWLKLYLRSDLAQAFMRDWQTTTVQATLNLRDLRRVPIAVPPAHEREAIAEVLGALDDKIALNDRIASTARELARAAMEEIWGKGGITSLVRSETAVPAGWRRTTLGALCAAGGGAIQTGPFGSQLHASDYVDAGIPSVMPQDIGDNLISEEGIARITAADAERLSKYLLTEGDIVYSRRGDVKRRALVRKYEAGWLCGTGCLRVRVGTPTEALFISYYLGEREIQEWIAQHAVGATMPNLNTAILGDVPVVLPPGDEVRRVNERLTGLDVTVAHLQHENRTLADLRDTLLPQLLSGKLRVRDAVRAVEEVV